MEDSENPESPLSPSPYQSRRFILTINNYTENLESIPDELKELCTGIVWGREVAPTTGTKHIQAFILTKKRYTNNGIIRRLHSDLGQHVHVERARGNAFQCWTYCTKEGDFESFGTLPRDGYPSNAVGNASSAECWDAVFKCAIDGDFESIPSEKRLRYWDTLFKIHSHHRPVPERLPEQPGVWIYGPAGYGKSWSARHDYGQPVYVKPEGKWWTHEYTDQPVVILDDFDPEQARDRDIRRLLKIWGDIYPFNAESKGGFVGLIRPKRFIVTSQYTIEECFPDARTRDAIARRFRFVQLHTPWDGMRRADVTQDGDNQARELLAQVDADLSQFGGMGLPSSLG